MASMNNLIKYLILLLLFALSGCTLFSPVKVHTETKYTINSLPAVVSKGKQHHSVLLVLIPETSPMYDTTRMAYTIRPYQIAYFGRNQWAETPSQMLLPLIAQTLTRTHSFRAVVITPYAGHYDYILRTQILQIEQDFKYRPALLRFTLQVQLVKSINNQLVAIKELSVIEPMLQSSPYGGVLAANRATQKLLQQIAIFFLSV